MKITLDDGKYEYVSENGNQFAYRYGETWRDLTGDNLAYAMACKIEELEQQRNELAATNERLRSVVEEYHSENIACEEAINELVFILKQPESAALSALKAQWQADKRRMDWLEHQYVSVRKPARYGSFHAFDANVGDEMEWENNPSSIRQLIDDQLE